MPFELFDPQAGCDRLLPLNEMQNRVTFYRIYVFDKTLDQLGYADQMSNPALTRHDELGTGRNTRLALPIPTLFPGLKDAYAEVRLRKDGEQPIKISLDGAYLPIDPDAPAPNVAKPIAVGRDAVEKGRLKLGDAEVQLTGEEQRLLLSRGRLLYNASNQVYSLTLDQARPSQQAPLVVAVGRDAVEKGRLKLGDAEVQLTADEQRLLLSRGRLLYNASNQVYSLTLDQARPSQQAPLVAGGTLGGGSVDVVTGWRTVRRIQRQGGPGTLLAPMTTPGAPRSIDDIGDFVPLSVGPDFLNQAVFDEVVGAILADPRSGQADRGRPSPRLRFDEPPYELLDQEFAELYWQFVRDLRWFDSVTQGGRKLTHGIPNLPRYDIGVFTTFEQVWTLQGYSRGALVNSITLAPQEELSIEVFTWSKSKTEEEQTVGSEMEKNTEIGSMGRASNSVARDLQRNHRHGR